MFRNVKKKKRQKIQMEKKVKNQILSSFPSLGFDQKLFGSPTFEINIFHK